MPKAKRATFAGPLGSGNAMSMQSIPFIRQRVFLRKIQKAFFTLPTEEDVWEMCYGRKERMWSPDRRPKSEQGKRAWPGPHSKLSWGGPHCLALPYADMVGEHRDAGAKEAAKRLRNQRLGSAAVPIFGETAKGDEEDESRVVEGAIRAQVPEGDARTISGPVELAEMIFGKYGHYHDVAVVRNSGQVALNIYRPSLGMRTFPYTEAQYLQKLGSIVAFLNKLDQAWYVKNFLLSPLAPRNMLPSMPQVDTAVTVRLNLSPTWDNARSQAIVSMWFAMRGMRLDEEQ